jgi:GR25 family glycosyltransferase involved in LPS biosynthesis
MKINECFDKIYCINLDERPDRWESALNEFKKVGLDSVERFSAVKHDKGVIGCRESHLNIIKKAKENKLNNVLIFEDDIKFVDESIPYISNTLEQLNTTDWSLFYLGATVDPNVSYLTEVSDNLVKTNFAYTTHAYAINSNVFDKILNEAPYHPIIDVFYCRHIVSMGNSLIMNPMLAIQQEGYSNIENHQADYGWMLDFFNKIKLKSGITW